MKEIWREIPDYSGIYEVSNKGNVRSLRLHRVGSLLSQHTLIRHGLEYKFVTLGVNRKNKRKYVHRLVAMAFIENPENKPQVDHINGNTLDNSIQNLRWATAKENINNPLTIERMRKRRDKIVSITETDDKGNVIRHFQSMREAARETGIPQSNISRACRLSSHRTHGRYFHLSK